MIGKIDIEATFAKQLARIGNGELRAKVVETFVLACRRGGWESVDAVKTIPFTLLTETHGINFVEHTIAVTEGAAALGRAQIEAYAGLPYAIDFDRLYAGGLLHDVGKLLEIEPDGRGGFRKSLAGRHARHPVSGAILASECGLRATSSTSSSATPRRGRAGRKSSRPSSSTRRISPRSIPWS